ncbi:hypothetical protein [Arenimonas aestuarii]
MLHIIHMIPRRRDGRPLPYAMPVAIALAAALMVGVGLLMVR